MTDSKPEVDRPAGAPQAGTGSRRIVLGIVALAGVLTVAASAMYWGVSERFLPEPPPRYPDAEGSAGAAGEAEPEVAAGPRTEPAPGAAPTEAPEAAASEGARPDTEADAEAAPRGRVAAEAAPGTVTAATGAEPQAPAFDLVRVERDGSAVIAGTAAPGARVTIRSDADALAEAEADADGNFVAIFRADPGVAPQALTLDAEAPDGTQSRSDEVVMLLPDAPAAEAAGRGEAAAEAAPEAEGEAGTEEPAIAATAVVRADGAVEVTQTEAPAPQPGEARQVTLATIAYSEAGEVTLSGLGTPAAELRAYVDGALAGEGAVAGDGRWALELDDLAEGLYRLRIDALDATGRVTSRVETPFQRDFPAAPLPRPGVEGAVAEVIDGAVTVQPGNTLWTLARVHYGSGVLFTQIFTANSELIRDPDLIYPGQVLALPGAEEAD